MVAFMRSPLRFAIQPPVYGFIAGLIRGSSGFGPYLIHVLLDQFHQTQGGDVIFTAIAFDVAAGLGAESLALAHLLAESLELLQASLDAGHHVFAINDYRLPAPVAQGGMQHGTFFGDGNYSVSRPDH
jgi:hypothetical protein